MKPGADASPDTDLRHLRAAALACLAALLAAPGLAQEPASTSEAATKASYLYKLAPFVGWPAQAYPGATVPFAICVIGRDPFGPLLDRMVQDQRVGERPIVVTRLPQADPKTPCQVAYLGGSPSQPVKQALRLLKGAPILTVTDGGADPGVVDLSVADGRVRLRIDEKAAAEDGLTISSKLLRLAVTVVPKKSAGTTP
jgi:hypothetical protein